MNTQLAKTFVQRGVIRQGTIIEAYQSAKGLSCVCDSYALTRYVVLKASVIRNLHEEWVCFEVASSAKDRHRVRCDYVASIDGMAIKRVAEAHQLNEDGSSMNVSPARGRRKPAAEQVESSEPLLLEAS